MSPCNVCIDYFNAGTAGSDLQVMEHGWSLPMSFTREETLRFYQRDTFRGVTMFAIDAVLLTLYAAGAAFFEAWYLQLLFAALTGTMIAIIFVIGHDAAHDSLTPHRWLNRLVGTFALLPSLHPYSMWVKLHNLRHHHYTNLKGKDDVWVPLDRHEYDKLPVHEKALYRFYRGPAGPLLYYLVEFAVKKFAWPTKKHYDGDVKRIYVLDALFVWTCVAGYVGLLCYSAEAGWLAGGPRPWWNPVLFAAVIPFFIWNTYSSLSIYLHHTHPRVVWYTDEAEWKKVSKAHVSVHARFPRIYQKMFHNIQEHSIHHLRPGVPIYHLAEAQKTLEEREQGNVIEYRWTPIRHGDICRRCKLYDFEAKRWMDFAGNYTSEPPRVRETRVTEELVPKRAA